MDIKNTTKYKALNDIQKKIVDELSKGHKPLREVSKCINVCIQKVYEEFHEIKDKGIVDISSGQYVIVVPKAKTVKKKAIIEVPEVIDIDPLNEEYSYTIK